MFYRIGRPCIIEIVKSRLTPKSAKTFTTLFKPLTQSYLEQSYLRLTSNEQIRQLHCSAIRLNDVVIKTPNFAESISEGDVKWIKSVGDYVNAGEIIGEIETDKTSLAVNATSAGQIAEFLSSDGSKVIPGDELVRIDTSVSPPETPKSVEAPDLSEILEVFPEKPQISSSPTFTQETTVSPIFTPEETVTNFGQRNESRVKISRMRKRIGERLKAAQNTYAMLTTFNEVDMTNVIAMRKRYADVAQKTMNVRLGFLSSFIVAAAHSLTRMPLVNATIIEDDIVYHDYIDISIAVSSPKGLVVPVIRDVGGLNFIEIEQKIVELSTKARDGTLSVEEMDGGTFTVSNGGVFGSLMSTPILNPPQSAILGLHAIKDRPVAIDGRVEIRPMMYLALTYDHRLIDGRESVTFLKSIKEAVEDPVRMLVGL